MIVRTGRPGILRGIVRTAVVAGTAQAVAGRINHRQQQRWEAEESPAPPQASVADVAPQTGTDHMLDALRQLGELRQSGILTEQEFLAKKAQILRG